MRPFVPAAFVLSLLVTAFVPAASADPLCLPGVPEQRPTCVGAGRCESDHGRGLCAGATLGGDPAAVAGVQASRAGACAGAAAPLLPGPGLPRQCVPLAHV